jgi:Family of unknown function (DUF5677)
MRAADRDRLGGDDESLAPFILYQQLIEQTDGIEVLFSASCVNAAVPLLRSAFETVLSLEYILVSERHVEQRSLAWTAAYLHRRIRKHEGLDASTAVGAARQKIWREPEWFSLLGGPTNRRRRYVRAEGARCLVPEKNVFKE